MPSKPPKPPKKSAGRPRKEDPLTEQLNTRVTRSFKRRVVRYQERHLLHETADAVRHALERILRQENIVDDEGEKK